MLSSSPKDGLNPYVFPLAILIEKGVPLPLVQFYLRSLYARLDKCVANVVRFMARYGAVTHVNSCFFQMFMWERLLLWVRSRWRTLRLTPRWLQKDETIEHLQALSLKVVNVKQATNKSLAKGINKE